MKLSIIVPCYNEERTIVRLIDKVRGVNLPGWEKEIIVVDDKSTDKTREILREINGLKCIFHEKNQGKGAAVRTGFNSCNGDVLIIQDADLEYDPDEYSRLLKPIVDGYADVVFSSRFVGGDAHRVFYIWHYLSNRFLTVLSNLLSGLNLSDMESCYKIFRSSILKDMTLRSKRFEIEVELTAKFCKNKYRIYEMPISYYGRTYSEGKKISWKDGFSALWSLLRYRFSN